MWSGRTLTAIRRNVLLPSLTLKMEAGLASEMSVTIYQITLPLMTEESNLHILPSEILISH
jgi:hypothetical protein